MATSEQLARDTVTRELTGRIQALPFSRWHYGMILLTGSALIFDTADAGLASASQVQIAKTFGVTTVQLGLLISAAFIGATVSAALIGLLAERFGRRRMIVTSILVFSLATAAASLAQNFTLLLVFRVIAGIGYGGLLPLAWAFGSEFAPVRARGRTLSWLNAFYGGGSAIAYLIGLAIIVPFGWRWGFAAFLIPALLAFAIARLMPEGIPFLVRRGREQQARANVERIEATVLSGRPRPEPVVDLTEQGQAGVSMLGATKQLFASRNLLRTISILLAWPIPALFVLGLLGFYPLIFIKTLHMPATEVLAFLTFSAMLTIVGRLVAGVVLDPVRRWSPSGLKLFLAVGVVFFGGVPFVIVSTHWSPAVILALLCIQYFTQGLWAGAAMTYIPTVLPLAIRTAGLGLFSALTNLAGIIGPILAGAILQFSGVQTLATWTLVVVAAAAVFIALFGHREQIQTVTAESADRAPAVRGPASPVLASAPTPNEA